MKISSIGKTGRFASLLLLLQGYHSKAGRRIVLVGKGAHGRHHIMLATRVSSQSLLNSGSEPNCFASDHFIDPEEKLIRTPQVPGYLWMKCEMFDRIHCQVGAFGPGYPAAQLTR